MDGEADNVIGSLERYFDDLPVGDITLEIDEETAILSYINADGEPFEVVMNLGERGIQRLEPW